MRCISSLCLFLLLAPPTASAAQSARGGGGDWGLRLRVVISGTSAESEPADYKIYSGVSLEGAVSRKLGDVTAIELAVRTESREVEGPRTPGTEHRLGAFEMLPIDLTLQWRPRGRSDASLQPYVGLGLNVTTTWEASGLLDSTHPPVTLGPAVQLGVTHALSPQAVLNVDARWHTMSVDFVNFAETEPRVTLDPLSLGLGVGISF